MEKILVQWTDKRSKGVTILVIKSTVKGTIDIGEKVEVALGRTTKKYNAVVMNLSCKCPSPDIPQQGTSPEDETFTFELAESAPQTFAETQGSLN